MSSDKYSRKEFTHKIQLQLFDGNMFPVDGTQFWVTFKILTDGNKVTLQLPTINFLTGPLATGDVYAPLPGGFLRTVDGFLPKELCPSEPVYVSIWLHVITANPRHIYLHQLRPRISQFQLLVIFLA